MDRHSRFPGRTISVVVFAVLYLALHIWTLPWYPFVHSDEVWLASLSRTMWSGGAGSEGGWPRGAPAPGATEEFFRLTPRHPHALKTLYHLLQGPLVTRWWGITAARLPSLAGGLGALGLTGLLLRRCAAGRPVLYGGVAALALDPLFFTMSHMGRQEALITAAMVGAVVVLAPLVQRESAGGEKPGEEAAAAVVAAAASIIGVAIFIHPTAFIAACAATPWVPRRRRELLVWFVVLAAWGAAAIGASFALDGNFLVNYRAFGDSVGVTAIPVQRVARLREYVMRLWHRVAGTYYLPPVRPMLAAAAVVLPVGLVFGGGTGRRAALSLGGVVAGTFLVGKYSPPATAYVVPWVWVSVVLVVDRCAGAAPRRTAPHRSATPGSATPGTPTPVARRIAPVILLVVAGIHGATLLQELYRWHPDRQGHYHRYIAAIAYHTGSPPARHRSTVDRHNDDNHRSTDEHHTGDSHRSIDEHHADALHRSPPGNTEEVVLANLNAGFAFAPGRLRVWRDLGALPPLTHGDGNTTEEQVAAIDSPAGVFLREENVRWVVLPRDELALIHNARPVWNDVYGNPHRFYREIMEILERYGDEVYRFDAGIYGMRLVPYMDRRPHMVSIYRVDLPR